MASPAASVVPVVVDWKAVGPYPPRTAAEAARVLSKPGADTTANDHFWDGINRLEPQRLALAMQAGAVVRQTNAANHYTPLMTLAEACDLDRHVEAQVSIAEQLITAGADAKAVHPDGWTALIIAAADCPLAVIRMLVEAGSPLIAERRMVRQGHTSGRSAPREVSRSQAYT